MPLLIRIFFINLLLVVICSGVCRYNDPNINEYFQIFCTKSKGHVTKLVCTKPESPETWSNLPRLNGTGVKLNMDRCRLPADLQLADLFRSMQLREVVTFQLTNSSTIPTRTNFQDLIIDTIELENCPLEDLPSDLLHDTQPRSFYLVNTMLRAVPHNFFSNSNTIFKVEIVNSRLEKLKRDDFQGLINVHTLLLFGNVIDEIEAGTFDTLLNLKSLDLCRNRLKTLPGGLFQNIPTLEIINIGANQFDELPGDLFRKNDSRLRKFRMSLNEGTLKSLPAGLFRDLRHIHQVEALSNGFESIPADVFSDSTMQSLNISENRLTELPVALFSGNYQLKEVWIMANNLTALPDGLFDDTILEVLQLSNNQLTNITRGMLMGLENLKVLDVSNNFLKFIYYDAYKLLKKIEYIDVSYNQLTLESTRYDGISVLFNLVNLKSLDAKYNNITQVFDHWTQLSHLENVDLEGNLIKKITERNLRFLNNRTTLNLRKNQITTIDISGINTENYRGSKVYATENPLVCDCHLLELIKYTQKNLTQDIYDYVNFVAIDTVKCTSPVHLKGKTLKEVHWPDLRCEIKLENSVCNGTCICWEYSGRQVVAVDCTSRSFHTFPETIKNLEGKFIEVYMTYNSLTEIPPVNLLPQNISVLDLSSNNISILSEEIFTIDSLQQLKLHNNRLTRLDNNVLSRLQDHKSLTSLSLHSNPWLCDCNTRDFLSFVQKNLVQLELHGISCAETGENFSTVTASEICSNASTITLTVCAVVVVFAVLAAWITAMCIKYKKHVKIWLYSKQLCLRFVTEEELDKDKQYDAFISYSHLDEDFVLKDLVPELESGSKPYQLCLHYRDWVIGEWIPAQIAHSVEESRRTIIVLSPNFLESVWGKIEFQTAHRQALNEGRARVIVILYGDVGNIQNLDPDLKAYLSMNTYIKWGDPWFWDRLRYALPHRRELSRTLKRTSNAQIIGNYLSTLQESDNVANSNSESDSKCVEVVPIQEAETLLNVRHKDALMA
ncbi:unnamed protein product [Trichogramma brassicae]|uniref:TIR domain-containing protein n=1 Tax=Trichogramma brassicae TaxID=86971 RepID=A0A6H5IPX9_9HYME|nr:unnamed protein product [Trichogramma brassicae]